MNEREYRAYGALHLAGWLDDVALRIEDLEEDATPAEIARELRENARDIRADANRLATRDKVRRQTRDSQPGRPT